MNNLIVSCSGGKDSMEDRMGRTHDECHYEVINQ